MARLQRTRQAENDLLEIWAFIASENPLAADKIVRKLDERSHELLENPKLGPARPDIAKEMRHLVMDNYIILYRVFDSGIEIVRYLHGARNLYSLL